MEPLKPEKLDEKSKTEKRVETYAKHILKSMFKSNVVFCFRVVSARIFNGDLHGRAYCYCCCCCCRTTTPSRKRRWAEKHPGFGGGSTGRVRRSQPGECQTEAGWCTGGSWQSSHNRSTWNNSNQRLINQKKNHLNDLKKRKNMRIIKQSIETDKQSVDEGLTWSSQRRTTSRTPG